MDVLAVVGWNISVTLTLIHELVNWTFPVWKAGGSKILQDFTSKAEAYVKSVSSSL